MANKFLGLDSINVLKDYIDEQINTKTANNQVVTMQAYKYVSNTDEAPKAPQDGGFDFVASSPAWPTGWNSLEIIMKDNPDLSEGSIWMTVGFVQGKNTTVWSTPTKISGQDGEDGVDFRFSYNEVCAHVDRLTTPPELINETGKDIIYYWVKPVSGEWPADDVAGSVWMKYTTDGKSGFGVKNQYCVTDATKLKADGSPAQPDSSAVWVEDLQLISVSQTYPYLWMRSQIVTAGEAPVDDKWVGPVLFSMAGKDGNVPDYTVTLYCKGLDIEGAAASGIKKPIMKDFVDGDSIEVYEGVDYYMTAPTNVEGYESQTDWVELPETIEENEIWWQCTLQVTGQKYKNAEGTEDENKVTAIGDITRYNAVDGESLPGQFTVFKYMWSDNQLNPALVDGEVVIEIDNWSDSPVYTGDAIEPSLWMISNKAEGYTEAGEPNYISEWTDPVKLSGPRGPIAYDFRVESRYNRGTEAAPDGTPKETAWYKPEDMGVKVALSTQYPYWWCEDHLLKYTMKYDTTKDPDKDGNYPIIVDDSVEPEVIKTYPYYRLSGLDGEDGNRKNSVKYNLEDGSTIEPFSSTNLYISNLPEGETVTYTMLLDKLAFVNGYTGKFANIGKGTLQLNSGDYTFVGSDSTATTLIINPQETIELVCYNDGDDKVLLVIGKDISI